MMISSNGVQGPHPHHRRPMIVQMRKTAQESDPENRNQRLTDEDFANMERKRSEESEDTKLRKKLDNQRKKTRNYKNSEAN